MALLGYGRVSTDGQSLTAQVAELKAAGCIEIFQEKVSGAKSNRKQLARLIGRLDKDDVLVVTRLDRLALYQGLAQSARRRRRQGRRLQVAAGHLGRYHDGARQVDADGPGVALPSSSANLFATAQARAVSAPRPRA